MKKRGISGALALAAVATSTRPASADLRSFTHTYEYSTVPAGNTTVDIWHTQTRAGTDSNAPQIYQSVLEIEHGITEHLDMAFFTVLEQIAGGLASEALQFSAARLEARYRFAERAELPVDTAVHVGAAKQFGDSVYALEARLVGARDFGDLTIAANAIGSVEVGRDVDDTEPAFGWRAGATFQAHPKLRLGVESWGVIHDGAAYADIGPAISFAPSSGFWTAVTIGVAMIERDEAHGADHGAFSARAIFGIEL